MQIDAVINTLNKKVFFKTLAFLILSFPTFQNYGQMQTILVAIVTPNYTCQYSTNPKSVFNVSQDQCFVSINGSTTKCTKWNFSPEPLGTTMMSDYGLVCDKKNSGDVFLLVWYASSFTGILMGWLSDRYGRKRLVILNLCIECASSILLAFSPNVEINIVLRFCLGISASSIYITFVWLMESVNVEFREVAGSFFIMFGCLAYMTFPLLIHITKNWRYTQLISVVPSLLYFLIYFIPESPRWLFVVGRRKEGITSLKTICKINKININFEHVNISVTQEVQDGSVLRIQRSHLFLFRCALLFLLQFSTFLIYMGVTMNISILSSNILFSMFLLGLMETPGILLAFVCLHYLKRKLSILIFGGIGSTLFWISIFFRRDIFWQSIVRITLGCIAKAFIASTNQITLVYMAELFPTSHRSFSFVFVQLANFLSVVGGVYFNKLASLIFYLPMTIYLVLIWTSSILTFCLLPETKNLPFPETLDDQIQLKTGSEEDFVKYMENKNNTEETIHADDDYEKLSLLKTSSF